LKNNPEAFGSTYEREVLFSLDYVAERLRVTEDQFIQGAFQDDSKLVGIVTFMRETGFRNVIKEMFLECM